MKQLVIADLPGNVRQLRDVVAEAHGRCSGRVIGARDLPAWIVEVDETVPWSVRKVQMEQEEIEEALARNRGNVTRAARDLHVHRTTLWRKMRRLGIKA